MKLSRASHREGHRADHSTAQGRLRNTASGFPAVLRRPAPGSILLVEDNQDDALFLKRSLRVAGITMPVMTVQDGVRAIAYFHGDPPFSNRKKYPLPSIVMLDVHLPDINGFEVLEWLRSQPQFKHLFIAMVTVSGKIGDIARAYRLGANSFLSKPCYPDDIRKLAQGFPAQWSLSAQAV
jgi:CheY-like chemotaxis protein